jgi:hypothetical protein
MFDSRSLQPPLDGSVPDIRYSAQWRRLVAEMSDAERDELHFAGLTADGVQPYGKWSKKYSCWFFYLELLHLPPWVRRRPENTLLLAVSLGGAQPKNMQSLLGALVPMLNQAFTHGFAVFNGRLNSSVFFRFAIFRIYADGPALAKILHRYLHNGYSGCLYCLIRGMHRSRRMLFLHSDNRCGKKHHAWVESQVRLAQRTSDIVALTIAAPKILLIDSKPTAAAADTARQDTGVYGKCWLQELVYCSRFELLAGGRADLMHCVAIIVSDMFWVVEASYPAARAAIREAARRIRMPTSCPAHAIIVSADTISTVQVRDNLLRSRPLTRGLGSLRAVHAGGWTAAPDAPGQWRVDL